MRKVAQPNGAPGYESVANRPSYGSWEADLDTEAVDWSPEVFEIFGLDPADFVPSVDAVLDRVHPEDRATVRSAYERTVAEGVPFRIEHRIVRPDGADRTVEAQAALVPSRRGGPRRRLVGTVEDTTHRRSDREQLWVLANHDPLTGLLNRRRFTEELEREVAVAARRGTPGAVLMVDLDRFKDVNDSLGHATGDELLVRVADLLRTRLRSTDTLGRLGGDEFAVVLPACDVGAARAVAGQLHDAVRTGAGVVLGGRDFGITTSIGIAPFGPDGGASAEEVLIGADLAMYRAKADGGSRLAVFDEQMRAALARRVREEGELARAIERGELWVAYQPVVSLADDSIRGCEALVRWQHPERGTVLPGAFVPLAEETGLINEIGRWVIGEACRQAAEWRAQGANLAVSVNVAPRQLIDQDVTTIVAEALARSGLPAPALTVELTETSLHGAADRIAPPLADLRDLGVRIAVDDFGSGASSLSFLRLLPVDEIKIDRMFVGGISDRADDRAIVAAVLSLAGEMGLTVVAEGVEHERQQWELREMGCPLAQGYLYAYPTAPDRLDLAGFVPAVWPGIGDPSMIREFMRQIGIPARIDPVGR